ncbi:hypothetical protein ABPG74_017348 [Tetrahymena malaccensis]
MVSLVAERRHLSIVDLFLQAYGFYVLYHSLLDIHTSNFYKYSCAIFFIIDKIFALKRVFSNPTIEYLLDQVFHLDIQILKKKYYKRLSFNSTFILASFFLTLLEFFYFENTQKIYQLYIWACLFGFYLFFYQDWIGAIDAIVVQYMVLNMFRLFYLHFRIKESCITIACEIGFMYFFYMTSFDQPENKQGINFKEITIGIILAMFFGISLPFNLNKREYILKDQIFKVLGQTQAMFCFNILFTLKMLFYEYSYNDRVLIILYMPIFAYRIYSQIIFFVSGPYITTLEIDCNAYNKVYRQLSGSVLQCKVKFLHFSCNWACDQVDILQKINKNVLFTYELQHGAMVSLVNYEQHAKNDVISVDTNNLSVLIFGLYIYSTNKIYSNLRFHFDPKKFREYPEYQFYYYLIRYPFVSFYSKQINYDGEEVEMHLPPFVRQYQREIQQQVKVIALYEKTIKSVFLINQRRFQIFTDLHEL